MHVAPLPELIFSSIAVQFNRSTPVTAGGFGGIPNPELPGEETQASFVFTNPSNASHQLLFANLSGGVIFVNSTPNGTFVVPAHGSTRFYLTLSAVDPPGTYALVMVFRVVN